MFQREKGAIVVCILYLVSCTFYFSAMAFAQDEKIIERYKLMLSRNPKEGSTFDRLYQFYLEGAGLDAMIADYQAEAEAKPNDASTQLILGHIYKRLGKDLETVTAYQRAVELTPNAYYPHFAVGQMFATLRQHENAIRELTKAAELSEQTQAASPEELMEIYKALGRAYFSRDRVDAAISAWKKIPELDPENIFSRIELADLFREQELYGQAIAQHEAIIGLKTNDPYRVCLSLREIGNTHNEKGDYADAIQSYDAAMALTAPGNWLRKDLQHRVIGIYAADGNWDGLIAHYQKKLEDTPNDPELIDLLAAAYIENQQLDEGIATYQQAVELAPTDTGIRLNLITALRNAEKFEEAAAAYETLSEQQPDDFGIYRELGELYLQLKDENRARATYQRMLTRNPDNARTHLILAEIYAGNDWIDDAIAAYQKAIALEPNNLDYIEYFGEFYFRHADRQNTVKTWNQMVAGEKSVPENYDRLAQLLDAKDFRAEAIVASRKAVELAPDSYRYREALARRLTANKHYDEALTEYAEAEKLAPNPFFAEQMADQQIEIYRRQRTLVEKIEALETDLEKPGITATDAFAQQKQLAKMYLKLGNITYAIEVLLKTKALHPDDVLINRWLAGVYDQQGLRAEADTIYTHLIEIDSANAREYYANIARAAMNVMDFENATDAAKQAVAHSPRNPEGHQMLAQIAKQVGSYEIAIDSLKQAIRLRPEATDIRSELAEIYKLSGETRQAIEQYWRCWELSASVNDKLAFVKPLSEAYYDLGRRDELEEKLKRMSRTSTSIVGPVVALAELYQMEGDLPNARFQLARALDRDRENSDLLAQLVKVSLDLGDTQEALTYQQRLAKVQPDPNHQQRLGELLFDTGREQEAIQAWTKLLHAKNQPLEAEIRLATLLIRHGLLDEAVSVLDRAAEKITGADAHIARYQLGATLVKMNEFDRARPHFQRILDMPEPPQNAIQNVTTRTTRSSGGPPGINTRRFALPQQLVWDIQGQSFAPRSGQQWIPKNFEEARAGALVQLTTIAQQQRRLTELIQQFEAEADTNPKNIQNLETLVQIYILTQNTDKTKETIDRLLAVSPKDPIYQSLRLSRTLRRDIDYETLKKYLDAITGLTSDARLYYIASYASDFYRRGWKADAEKLVIELEAAEVTDIGTASMLVTALTQMKRTDAAERILAQLPVPATLPTGPQTSTMGPPSHTQQWSQYRNIYKSLVSTYVRAEQIDKALALLWTFFERTKPYATTARRISRIAYASYTYSGYTPLQSSYPSATTYYDQNRLEYLQQVFSQLWTADQQDALYAKLQAELDSASGRDRIYPGLALSYCYWWAGQRDTSQEVLSALQQAFPDDLTLKLNTVFAAIQIGRHAKAVTLLEELADVDAKNRHRYYNLTLQLAAHTGDTVAVRELITKVLNSPIGVRELYQFSQKLQQSGLTQYAIPIANKATTLAMAQRDPNFLIELSQHLEELGRGKDASRIAERALRFANQRDRYGQTLYSWRFQQASRMVGRSKAVREREPQLIEAVQKDPDSFQARVKLARFYESTNQLRKAADTFEAALALRPEDSMTRQRYAQMLQRSGQAKAAVTQYSILLKDNPNTLGYNYWEVMETFFQADKVDELVSIAKGMIAPAVGRNFGSDFARNAARQCVENNRPEAAVELYEKIVEVQPDQTYTYHDLASAYAAAGEPEKAIRFLREKLETEYAKLTQDSYAQVQMVSKLTELHKTSGGLEDLVTEYEAKLAEKPEDPALIYLVAAMKIAAGNLEGADPLVSQLIDDTGAINTGWVNSLADAYRSANDRDRERRMLESAIAKMHLQQTWELSESYQKLGTVYARQDEKAKAQDAFRKMGTLRLLQRGAFYEKEQIANTYMQHEMWDDAEALLNEIINDFSAQQWGRQQAQQQLAEIQRRRNRSTTTPQTTEETPKFNVGMQRTLAQQHAQQGEVKKAIDIYEKIAKVMPEDLESRAQLATLYSRQNKHDAAVDIWEALLEADPENTKYQDGLVDTYQDADKTDEALGIAQQYIASDPESSVHHIRLAELYAANDEVDTAIDTYEKAIELGTGDGDAYLKLAQLHLRKDNLDAAEKAFEEAIQHTGQEWERRNIERQLMSLYRRQGKLEGMLKQAEDTGALTLEMQQERAREYRNAGELGKAVAAYKKALEMTAQSWDRGQLSNELLRVYAQLGQNDAAIELYETQTQSRSMGMSIHHGPSGIKVMFGGDEAREILINAYKNQGKLEALRGIFEGRLEKDSDNPVLLEILAEIHRNADNHEKTAEAYQTLCKAQPSNVRSFYYAAAALHKINRPDLAKELMQQGETALSANTRRQDMWFLAALASICLEGEMYDPAIKFVEDAIAASSRYGGFSSGIGDLYGILGKSYLGTKQYEQAANAYQQMVNLSRHNYEREKAEAGLRRAHREGNLYEKQIPEKLQRLTEDPEDLEVRLDLAQTYEWSDGVDAAIAQYEKIVELQPDNAEWHKKIGDLTRKSRLGDEATRFTKAVAAYEKAIELEPTSYQSYAQLAETYVKRDRLSEAEAVYRRALEASLEEHDYNGALRGIWKLYDDAEQQETGIAVLEELRSKVPTNALRLELLGDAYKEADAAEKADAVYAEWLVIRQKEVNRTQRGWDYRRLADQLLRKAIMPEKALELAERASQMQSDWNFALTLGHAYVANDRYEEALEQFTRGMNGMGQRYTVYTNMARQFWTRLAQVGKNATDEARYIDMVKQLISLPSSNSEAELYANVTLAQFYHARDLPEKAKAYMDKTAFIAEEAWWIIGPFDNADGIGYNNVYIPETETQVDTTAEYDAIEGQVHWKKQTDDTFDGFVDFRNIFDESVNWNTAYAWTVVNVPDKREAQLRFGSGTQAKLWLNGEEVFTHSDVHTPAMDQDTIPVTLKAGKNSILVKVCSEMSGLGFYLRLTDSDGKPFADEVLSGDSTND